MKALEVSKLVAFILKLFSAIVDLVFGLMLQNPETAFQLLGMPLNVMFYISLGIWGVCAFYLFVLAFYHSLNRPIYGLGHMCAIAVALWFFTLLGFQPSIIHVWGPLASALGIVLSVGLRATWNSADRRFLCEIMDIVFSRSPRLDNYIPQQPGYEFRNLGQNNGHHPHNHV